jgi:hypothetical protein
MLNELARPTCEVNLEIELPKLDKVEHDLGKVEVFATNLEKFYDGIIEDLDIKTIKSERTKVRKILKTVADNRKAMVKAYKAPIDDFESTSKRIEKILSSIDSKMKELVDADKLTNTDPFEGLSLTNEEYTIVVHSKEGYNKVMEFIKKEGII